MHSAGNGEIGGGGSADAIVEVVTDLERDGRSQEALVRYAQKLGPDPRWDTIDDIELDAQVRTGAAQLAALTCVWLEHLGELVTRGIYAQQGCRTPARWLSWALGIGPSTSREHVRVALRLRECPLLRDRFAAGTLSYSKVRAITRVCTPDTEQLLLDWADDAPAAELEAIIRDTRRAQRAAQSPTDRDDLGLSTSWRDDNTFEITIRVDAATGLETEQHLDRLLELARERADDDNGEARPTRGQTLADEVLGAIAMAVAAGPDDTSGADRHLAVVELSAAVFIAARDAAAGASAEAPAPPQARPRGAAFVGSGRGSGRRRPLPLLQIGRLICASRIDLHLNGEADGHPADLGTAHRYPDARLRRLLLARDRSCRFPGCGAHRFLHAHHVRFWEDGGPTDLDNLVLLCGFHHRLLHAEGWVLRSEGPGRWTFHQSEAAPARAWSEPLPSASAEALGAAVAAHAHNLDPRALTPPTYDGYGHDRDMAVGVLLDRLAAAA